MRPNWWFCRFACCHKSFSSAKARREHLANEHQSIIDEGEQPNPSLCAANTDQRTVHHGEDQNTIYHPTPSISLSSSEQDQFCIVLGNEEESFTKMIVNGQMLAAVSPIFKTMITGGFIETTSRMASLTEDDPDALFIMLLLAHEMSEYVADQLSLKEVLEVGKICYKYACLALLEPWARRWIRPHFDLRIILQIEEHPELVDLAFLFGSRRVFESALEIVHHQSDPAPEGNGLLFRDHYLSDLFWAPGLEDAVLEARAKTITRLRDLSDQYYHSTFQSNERQENCRTNGAQCDEQYLQLVRYMLKDSDLLKDNCKDPSGMPSFLNFEKSGKFRFIDYLLLPTVQPHMCQMHEVRIIVFREAINDIIRPNAKKILSKSQKNHLEYAQRIFGDDVIP